VLEGQNVQCGSALSHGLKQATWRPCLTRTVIKVAETCGGGGRVGIHQGGHVAEYMTDMLDEEPEKYNEHFKSYKDEGIEADDLEELYPKVHAAIRADPVHVKKARKMPAGAKSWKPKKMTYAEKKTALKAKLLAIKAGAESE